MSKETKNKGKARVNLIAALSALAIGIGLCLNLGFDTAKALNENCRVISDAFFIVGICYTGIGALTAIATTGFFDILGYAFKSLFTLFAPIKRPGEIPAYFDYKTAKAEKRGEALYGILIVGLCCIVISALMLCAYYRL